MHTLRIPDGVTIIPKYCFMGCNSLLSVELPAQLSTIGEEAFRDCRSLSAMVLPHPLCHRRRGFPLLRQLAGNRPSHVADQVGKEALRQVRRACKTGLQGWLSTGVQIYRHQESAALRAGTKHRCLQKGKDLEKLQNHQTHQGIGGFATIFPPFHQELENRRSVAKGEAN